MCPSVPNARPIHTWPNSCRRIEKKKQLQAQISAWAAELAAGSCPPAIREQLYRILFKPDKNAPEYKAVVEASRATQTAPLTLLQNAGAITSPYQFHWKRFLLEYFPKGTDLSRWSAEDLEAVAHTLNNRPRKTLGWKTPAEVFEDQLRSLQQPGVASTS